MIYIIFILAVMVNGATDAANAITGVVSGKLLSYRQASFISAALNFAGLSVFAVFLPSVSKTVENMTSGGKNEALAILASVVIFAGSAWIFSVPTSESHALIAAMAGASAAIGNDVDYKAIIYITLGALLSAALGAVFGAFSVRLVHKFKNRLNAATIAGSAATSFFHGAQDGQKFLALSVATGLWGFNSASVLFVALAMFMGTLFGGKRIVKKLGEKMTELETVSAVSSDIGSALSLLIITVLGIPASTTHTKICAMAAASAANGKAVDKKELLSIVFGWVLTLPCCFILAYFITKAIN